MTIPRLVLNAGLLAALPAVLSGCGQGDGGEFRAYSAPLDTNASTVPPSANPAPDSASSGDVRLQPAQSADAALIEQAVPPAGDASPTTPVVTPGPATAETTPAQARANDVSIAAAASGTPDSASATPVVGAPAPTGAPREVRLLVPERTFQTVGPDGALRVTYNDLDLLKVLNMDPVTVDAPEHFPQWLSDLEGKRIRLRGYMRPDLVAEGLTGFILARDTQACCFGPNTKAYDIIPTMLRDGATTDYIELRPFDVVGVFHIEVSETRSRTGERKVEFLYNIDDAVIIQL